MAGPSIRRPPPRGRSSRPLPETVTLRRVTFELPAACRPLAVFPEIVLETMVTTEADAVTPAPWLSATVESTSSSVDDDR